MHNNTPPTLPKKKTQRHWDTKILWTDILVLKHFKPIGSDKAKFECIDCTREKNPFNTGKSENILTHLDSQKHIQALNDSLLNKKIIEAVKQAKYGQEQEETKIESENDEQRTQEKNDSSKLYQFELAKFLIENKLSFSLIQELIPFIKYSVNGYTPNALMNCDMNRLTVTKLVRHCICGSIKDELLEDLMASPFSLAMDETTDPYGSSYLAVCAKYHDIKAKKIVTKFVSVIPLEESRTGQAMYLKLKEDLFSKNENLIKNLISIATDQGSSMIGARIGLGAYLTHDCPHLVKMHDLSHIYNLIAQSAIKTYPSEIRKIISSICKHFNKSSIRAAKLEKLQTEMGFKEPLRVLSYVKTRWLSRTDCLRRIIKLWEPLKKYYKNEEDEKGMAYFLPKNELYLRILLVLLEKLSHYNVQFQTDNMSYNMVAKEMELSFKEFAIIILSNESWNSIKGEEKLKIRFDAEDEEVNNLLKTEEAFQNYWKDSHNFQLLMTQVSDEDRKEVMNCHKMFIKKVLIEMQKRLPFWDDFLEKHKAIFLLKPPILNDWKYLLERFTNIIPLDYEADWRLELDRFALNDDIVEEAKNFKNDFLTMWYHFGNTYPLISRLAIALLTVAHSSVPVERVFSWLKDVKSQKRNRLTVENLEACLLTSQKYGDGTSWTITDDMLKRRTSMWRMHSNPSILVQYDHEEHEREEEHDVLSEMIQDLGLDKSQAEEINTTGLNNEVQSTKIELEAQSNRIEEEKSPMNLKEEDDTDYDQEIIYAPSQENPLKRKCRTKCNGNTNRTKPGIKLSTEDKDCQGGSKGPQKNVK